MSLPHAHHSSSNTCYFLVQAETLADSSFNCFLYSSLIFLSDLFEAPHSESFPICFNAAAPKNLLERTSEAPTISLTSKT